MIEKQIQKVEINQIIESQIPSFLLNEENDGFIQLLKQYYISQEFQGSSIDIVENIPEYKNPDIFNNEDLIESTTLTSSIEDFNDEISVSSTLGWPSKYGLLKIDDEIITYTSKTATKFLGCIRGFSGIDQYNRKTDVSSLVFSTSSAASHSVNTKVLNLSNLFLKEFLFKSKSQFAPGFEDYTLADGLDQTLFLKRIVDFYRSKGTDEAFKVLFKILYGKPVKVIKPQDYLIKPSDAEYLESQALLVEFIEGEDLTTLETLSIVQNRNEDLNIFETIASISSVETLELNNTRLYRLVLDSATISGRFAITGRTKNTEFVTANSTTINVDSTIGFPQSGSFDYFDSFGDKVTVSYSNKTVNQFLGCTNVQFSIPEKTTLNYGNYAYIDNPFTGVRTTVKLLKVINNIENFDTKYFSFGDYVTIKSFGEYYDNSPKLNTWIGNVRASFNVFKIERQSTMYKITLYDSHNFSLGNKFELYDSVTNSLINTFTITQVISETEFLGNFGDFTLNTNKQYYIKKILNKVNSLAYPELTKYIGNVSNVYTNETDVYIASNSLPVYDRNQIRISASSNTSQFTTSNNSLIKSTPHNFYSGESVYVSFSSSTFLNGKYFLKVIDATTLKLSKSRSDVFSQKYIDFNSQETCNVTPFRLANKELTYQPILRKIPKSPIETKDKIKTTVDAGVGILVNGVELLSYKENDFISYGSLESIKVSNTGKNYDVINPPNIVVTDNFSGIGTGATIIPHLKGKLVRVDILDPGFDLIGVPQISISGGNGFGAKISPKIKSIEYSKECKANIGVNTTNDFISFEDSHRFKTGEEVYYINLGTSAIGVGTTSLIDGSKYFVSVASSTAIKLHNTKTDALTSKNPIDFNNVGNGIHKFQSVNNKNILSSVIVEDGGIGYTNAPLTLFSTNVNIFNSQINCSNHNLKTGEKIVYTTTGTVIGGLSTTTTYYAIKVDENNFKVATSLDNAKNNIYINFTSTGSGYHTFNYEPITITVNANNGFGLTAYNPSLRPIVLGEVYNAVLKDAGNAYGNSEIVNFEANPLVSVLEPTLAELKPIVVDGRIKEIIIDSSGSSYSSPPQLFVRGEGNGAKLVPIMNQFGGISSVVIESEGRGYDNKTSIEVIPFGDSLAIEAKVKKWNFERYRKNINNIKDDDGFLYNSKYQNGTLQFFSVTAPRELRKQLFVKNSDNTKNYSISDFDNDINEIKFHSPIIGWAYDGCPIYGQYGYETPLGGNVKKLNSGYTLKNNRDYGPSTTVYPLGTFIEDYEYTASGDLDEHNGRYCVTPEYPNGVYAYFSTNLEFPYVLGDTFSYAPEDVNLYPYTYQFDQNIDYEELKLKRYTQNYKLSEKNSGYEYFNSPVESLKFPIKIDKIQDGKIKSFDIISAGEKYTIGDKVVNNIDGEYIGEVTEVFGPDVVSLATTSISLTSCPISYDKTTSIVQVFTKTPHEFRNFDTIFISGISTSAFSAIQGFKQIGFSSITSNLSVGVGSTSITGIVTFLSLSSVEGIDTDSVLKIDNEKFLVLNKYQNSNLVRVLREYTTVGTGKSYELGKTVNILPTGFSFVSGINTDVTTKINRKNYFSPQYSIGVSTTGVGTTITIFTGLGYTSKDLKPKSIYIPNHGYITGQKLKYSNGNGTSLIVSNDGITTFTLSDQQFVYVAKYNEDEIGISTTPVGVGSTGFIGIGTALNILYFNNLGTGEYHSFETTFDEITTTLKKNVVTLTTKDQYPEVSTIDLTVLPRKTTYIKLIYDDATRRIVTNPKTVTSVDTLRNRLYIEEHHYETGDKILYKTTGTNIGGLVSNSFYFVIKQDNSYIKLVETLSETFKSNPSTLDLSSSGSGVHTFYSVNPRINIIKGNTIDFDTSDASLSEVISGSQTSVFSFNIYTDPDFTNVYPNINDIEKIGSVGIGTSLTDSKLSLLTNENTPKTLYYGILPINTNNSSFSKKQYVEDDDVTEKFKITVKDSLYDGNYFVTGITTNTFTFNLTTDPESPSYTSSDALIKYKTNNLRSSGAISFVKVTTSKSYDYPVTNLSIISSTGSGANIAAKSDDIGRISDVSNLAITSEIPSDPTLVPTVNFPQILRIDESSSLLFVGVSFGGRKYVYPPTLLVIDSKTNEIVENVDLFAKLSGTSVGSVEVISNTNSLYDSSPRIVSINNSNGIGINTISYNNNTKTVTVSLAASFSVASDYPFKLGDKVFVENIGIVSTSDDGFDSKSFNYQTFEVVGVNTNLGGAKPTVTYALPPTASNANVGILTCVLGRIVPEQDLPKFNVFTKINQFNADEVIVSIDSENFDQKDGKNVNWNSNSKIIKINSLNDFKINDIVVGKSSNTRGKVVDKINFESDFITGALTKSFKFFNKETGKISETFQRFEDSDYNQLFSYSLKSTIPYESWKTPVLGLAHISGYKAFADLDIVGIGSTQSRVTLNEVKSTFESFNEISFYERTDYDYAFENNLSANDNIYSNEITFNTKILTDYTQAKTNRALLLDDISSEFNSNPRVEKYSNISEFDFPNQPFIKTFIFVKDTLMTNDRSLYQVILLNDDPNFEQITYASNWTSYDLGYFDIQKISDSKIAVQFYPYNFEYNNYNVTSLSIPLFKDSQSGITTQSLGTVGALEVSSRVTIASTTTPIANDIVAFSTSKYSSSKVLVLLQSNTGLFQSNELTILNDGTNVILSEYAEMLSDEDDYGNIGFGTYSAEISGGNVVLKFTPSAGVGITAFAQLTSISQNTGIGTTVIGSSYIDSNYVSIASSISPVFNTVCSYGTTSHSASYILAEVKDTTNNEFQLSEIVLVNNNFDTYIEEYNVVYTNTSLGEFSSNLSGSVCNLTFKPISGIDVEVRTIKYVTSEKSTSGVTSFTNAEINYQYGRYVGVNNDLKLKFNLTSNSFPVFYKQFNGSNASVVSVTDNIIYIPSHFFSTGEKLTYSFDGSPIGIATTTISGFGSTDKLPSTVYVIKIDENKFRLSGSASDALSIPPVPLVISNVGIGTSHSFNPEKQNTKLLITVDNVIQSPLVQTGVAYTTIEEFSDTTSLMKLSGTKDIASNDILKINNEYIKVVNVGIGTTNGVVTIRGFFDTNIVTHPVGSVVKKFNGSYEVFDNTLYFVQPPYGKIGINSTFNSDFHGRVFLRSGQPGSAITAYSENYVFDDISGSFTGIGKTFTLKNSGNNITGISSNNGIILINNVIQIPGATQNYTLNDVGGTSTDIILNANTSAQSYDVNTTQVPRNGVIETYSPIAGFGLQPLVGSGGTAIVSIAGTISSVSIGNSGSGYRSGIQTTVYVRATNPSTGIVTQIGYANVSAGFVTSVTITNPGSGYTNTNPPLIEIDRPLLYENLPLLGGMGTGAKVSIVVGQGSSVIDFNITNYGYGYQENDILYVETGTSVGIQTISTVGAAFTSFNITINSVYTDSFSGWTFGSLQTLDDLTPFVDGTRRTFKLTFNGEVVDFRATANSLIELDSNIIVVRNGIIQEPKKSYIFTGGSRLTFTEAPLIGDKIQVMYYRGSSFDSEFVDVEGTIKVGDKVQLNDLIYQQDERIVTDLFSSDLIETNNYFGPGINTNPDFSRILTWIKQKEDLIIDGQQISKSRSINNSKLYPTSNIIKPISIGSTEIFVVSAQPLFKEFDDIAESDLSVSIIDSVGIGTTGYSNYEKLNSAKVAGDFGIISGVTTAIVGAGLTALVFDFVIPSNSALRNLSVVGTATTLSGISSNYYFVITDSNVGNGVTSLSNTGSVVSIGNSFIDNVYSVYSTSIVTDNAYGIGSTTFVRVTSLVDSFAGITTGTNNFYGRYSWGRIYDFNGTITKSFNLNSTNGLVGLTTSPTVVRSKQIITPY